MVVITKKSKKTVSGNNTRPSSRRSSPNHSSSGEEEYSFITDSTQVDKIACTWLGNCQNNIMLYDCYNLRISKKRKCYVILRK